MVSSDDHARVLASIGRIGASATLGDFATSVCAELLRLVPGLSASYNEINLIAGRVSAVVVPEPGPGWFERYSELFGLLAHEHPILAHYERTGDDSAVMTWSVAEPSDCFERSSLFRDFYAPNGIRSQLVFTLPAPPGIYIGLAVNRDGASFSSEELEVVELLRPHVANLYRLVSWSRNGAELLVADDGWSVVLVDDDGTVVETNEPARRLGRLAGVGLEVGDRLRGVAGPTRLTAGGDLLSTAAADPVPLDAGGRLEAKLVRQPVGPHLVWLRAAQRLDVESVMSRGLSRRRAEVAVLLTAGLTNADIAARLRIAEGTVRKHVEAVYRNLGVASRAAAVAALMAGTGSGLEDAHD